MLITDYLIIMIKMAYYSYAKMSVLSKYYLFIRPHVYICLSHISNIFVIYIFVTNYLFITCLCGKNGVANFCNLILSRDENRKKHAIILAGKRPVSALYSKSKRPVDETEECGVSRILVKYLLLSFII
jgi:hypothetical protein